MSEDNQFVGFLYGVLEDAVCGDYTGVFMLVRSVVETFLVMGLLFEGWVCYVREYRPKYMDDMFLIRSEVKRPLRKVILFCLCSLCLIIHVIETVLNYLK